MKHLFLSILFIGLISNVQAQDSSTIKKHEIGIGTGFFTQNLSNTNLISPYFFTYKSINQSNYAFRFGLGGYYSEENNDSISFSNPNDFRLAVRVGWEKRYNLAKNWLINVGGDLSYRLDQEKKSVLENNVQKEIMINSSEQFGFGVVAGFQYYFNDRISISTESTILFSFGEQKSETKMSSGVSIINDATRNRDLEFILPTSIFLVVAF
ncbi:MAG: hypothetical protein ACPG19_13830 [Saprospiraceae bacterium]|mgnify:CR=1 FL=1